MLSRTQMLFHRYIAQLTFTSTVKRPAYQTIARSRLNPTLANSCYSHQGARRKLPKRPPPCPSSSYSRENVFLAGMSQGPAQGAYQGNEHKNMQRGGEREVSSSLLSAGGGLACDDLRVDNARTASLVTGPKEETVRERMR